ncbi:hypothetical protein [Allocoleopsis franciscana]|uniref:Uncharacterized protein n=1 Tax=Allocoleopsis franciscana PCC 7113 TaxID=1173027 RepID=K9WDP5_9CYAN|nr:hypothetical protein [Allocoleopsis franciscana]AFZ18515.1 hypothetical protein Mic7113_2731 [Allocoleopsis franciscana PCC 7113]
MFTQKSNVNRFGSWELGWGKANPPQSRRTKLLFPLTVFLVLFPSIANALPGQRTEAVVAWINANPTLRPAIGNGLRVTRSSTPAQRFTFQASVLPPGRFTLAKDQGTIRSERMTFYDMINGVTLERLRESLRVIYGPTIYEDYERAQLIYDYPVPATIDLARRQNRPLLEQQQGELRLGDRFAYWLEITNTESGKAFNGQITVFLKEDLKKIETEVRAR